MKRFTLTALSMMLFAAPAMAQERIIDPFLWGGSGMSFGAGASVGAARARSPLFVEAGVRTWNSEGTEPIWGGSIRMEIEGRASVALVPRIELEKDFGFLQIRGAAALPMFVAPFTMFGPELGLITGVKIATGFHVLVSLMADAFFLGSDVPDKSVVLMFNGALGVSLEL